MTRRGLGLIVATVALASAAASAGAAANLRLLEPHQGAGAPVVLGADAPVASSMTVADAPSTSVGGPVDEPTTETGPDRPTTTSTPTTSPPPTSTTAPAAPRTYVVGQAGAVTVIVQAGRLTLGSIAPGDGWTYAVEHEGPDEIDVRFRRDSGEQAAFKATLDDGAVRVEIDTDEVEPPDD